MNLGEKIVAMFNDSPLGQAERMLFVNREVELTRLTNVGRFVQGSIYGLAGQTGCGKTTLLNMMTFPNEIQKLIITITEKESKEAIVADILVQLCERVLEEKRLGDVHKRVTGILRFMGQEETRSREKGVKLGKIVEGESKWASMSRDRYNIGAIKERLREVLVAVAGVARIVLCIDEIDKERKEDALVILDSMKDMLKTKNTSCLIALPPIMYQQYVRDRDSLFSEGNLENVLKDILPIHKMTDGDVKEMLDRRTESFPDVLPSKVKEVVIRFADGNPREALLLCQNAMLSKNIMENYSKEDFILTMNEIESEMEKFLRFRMDTLKLTVREKEFLRYMGRVNLLSRKKILNCSDLGISKATRHKLIQRLLEKGALQEVEANVYMVARRVQLYYQFFGTGGIQEM